MFHQISKHFEVGLKKSTYASFFNPLLSIWISDETLFLVFDILHTKLSQTKNARPSILTLPQEELQHGMIKPAKKNKERSTKLQTTIKKTFHLKTTKLLFRTMISHFKCNFLLGHGLVYVLIHHCILDCHSTKDRKCLYENKREDVNNTRAYPSLRIWETSQCQILINSVPCCQSLTRNG